jgi:hypothetical protein
MGYGLEGLMFLVESGKTQRQWLLLLSSTQPPAVFLFHIAIAIVLSLPPFGLLRLGI